MQLEALEAVPYSLPFRQLYATASGQLRERELVLVRARGEGLVGLGETASLSLRGGRACERSRARSSPCAGRRSRTPASSRTGSGRRWRAAAAAAPRRRRIAGVDVALHDLAGKASGQPVWRLIGARAGDPVKCNATLTAANPEPLQAMAEGWARDGSVFF